MSTNDVVRSAAQQIFTGVWTNWSHGKVLGATLTLAERDGNFLIAFIALFASYAGTCFFRITCFLFHLFFSTDEAEDGLYHQRQAILRNSASAVDALWYLVQLLWSWRKTGVRQCLRIVPFVVHATLCLALFTVAGIFSSRISSLTGDEVLIRSPNCGLPGIPANITEHPEVVQQVLNPYASQRLSVYKNYVETCYATNTSRSDCKQFVKSTLPYQVNRNASCPFSPEICKTQDANIKLDTGYLDSHKDLGFNAPESQRIQMRFAIHCAPLVTEGRKQQVNYTNAGVNVPYMTYSYGPASSGIQVLFNHTYMAPITIREQMAFEALQSEQARYSVGFLPIFVYNNSIVPSTSRFFPIEALQRNDSDLALIYLDSKKVINSAQVDDPWFSAHRYAGNITTPQGSYPGFLADEPAAPVACTQQYQTCVPSKPAAERCTPFGGLADSVYPGNISDPSYNLTQWINGAAHGAFGFSDAINTLGGEALQAKNSLKNSVQAPLPSNQWQLEMEKLFQIFMASIQGGSVESAMGPASEAMREFYLPPQDAVGEYFCKNQKIQSTEHANFSVLGLVITFVVGGSIVLLNWSIEWIYIKLLWHLQSRFNLSQYARMEWTLNGTLQLQRLAHEQLGYGLWRNCDGEVPMPGVGEKLATVDWSDIEHPKLMKARGGVYRNFSLKRGIVKVDSTPRSPESGNAIKRWDTERTYFSDNGSSKHNKQNSF